MNDTTKTTTTLADRAMLIVHRNSSWRAARQDRETANDVAASKGAKAGSYGVRKHLLPKDKLAPVTDILAAAKAHHHRVTVPWDSNGTSLLLAETYLEYRETQRAYQHQIEEAARAFALDYPAMLAQAEIDLGAGFDRDDYPHPDRIASHFGTTYDVLPVPDASHIRTQLGADDEAEIRASVERQVQERVNAAMIEVWTRLHKTVEHMADKLSDIDARVFDTMVENIREIVSALPSLNFTADPQLDAFRDEVEAKLCRFDADVFRVNKGAFDPVARETVAADAKDLAARMAAYMGALPGGDS